MIVRAMSYSLASVVMICLLVFTGCSTEDQSPTAPAPTAPASQNSFTEQCKLFPEAYSTAVSKRNDLKIEQAYHQAQSFLRKEREINGWIGKVIAVKKTRSWLLGDHNWMVVEYKGIDYSIDPEDKKGFLEGNDPLPIFKTLDQGNWVRFSGKADDGGMRITEAGSLTDPWIRVRPKEVQLLRLHY